MRRRRFLESLGAAAVAGGCSLCAARIASAAEGAHWSYEGAEGPGNWAGLSGDYKACGIGAEQLNGSASVGLLGMRERARAHGGRIEFRGNGDGTTVTVSIPI